MAAQDFEIGGKASAVADERCYNGSPPVFTETLKADGWKRDEQSEKVF